MSTKGGKQGKKKKKLQQILLLWKPVYVGGIQYRQIFFAVKRNELLTGLASF